MTFRQVNLKMFLDVPEIQNYVPEDTVVPGMGDITQAPRAVLYDRYDGELEFNLYTMNVDGTNEKQVTDH